MDFTTPRRRRPSESIVPMINVVFLLLIFFLMSAQITPPDPFEVTPPAAEAEAVDGGQVVLFLGPDGAVGFADLAGAAAVSAAAAEAGSSAPVYLRADREAPAPDLAGLLADLGAAGGSDMRLITAAE